MGSSSSDGRSAFVVEEGPALRQLVALAEAYMRRNELLRAGFNFGRSSRGLLSAAPILSPAQAALLLLLSARQQWLTQYCTVSRHCKPYLQVWYAA
jgi:hypothetical protein